MNHVHRVLGERAVLGCRTHPRKDTNSNEMATDSVHRSMAAKPRPVTPRPATLRPMDGPSQWGIAGFWWSADTVPYPWQPRHR